MINSFEGFSGDSRVWIYPADRVLKEDEEFELKKGLVEFTSQWTSHQIPVKAMGMVFFHRFVVIVAEEEEEAVSGCGIDKSVHFLKDFGVKHQLDFFNRMMIHFEKEGMISTLPMAEVKQKIKSGEPLPGTQVFFHGVSRLEHWRTDWLQKIDDSFLKIFFEKVS